MSALSIQPCQRIIVAVGMAATMARGNQLMGHLREAMVKLVDRALLDSEVIPEFRDRYRTEILDRVDLPTILAHLPVDAASALLCVERDPEACHRSLVAARMTEHGVSVVHLRP